MRVFSLRIDYGKSGRQILKANNKLKVMIVNV
jgi:hypothetical protein